MAKKSKVPAKINLSRKPQAGASPKPPKETSPPKRRAAAKATASSEIQANVEPLPLPSIEPAIGIEIFDEPAVAPAIVAASKPSAGLRWGVLTAVAAAVVGAVGLTAYPAGWPASDQPKPEPILAAIAIPDAPVAIATAVAPAPAKPVTKPAKLPTERMQQSTTKAAAEPRAMEAPPVSMPPKAVETKEATKPAPAIVIEQPPGSIQLAAVAPSFPREPVAIFSPTAVTETLTPEGADAPLPTIAKRPNRVVIHFTSGGRKRAELLGAELKGLGAARVEMRQVKLKIRRDELRYFHAPDKKAADALNTSVPLDGIRVRKASMRSAQPGLIEVWLRGGAEIRPKSAARVTQDIRQPPKRRSFAASQFDDRPMATERDVVIRKLPAGLRAGRGYLGRPPGRGIGVSPREGWPTCDC